MGIKSIIDDVIAIKEAIAAKDIKGGWAAEITLQQDLFAMVYSMQATGTECDPGELEKLGAACDECKSVIESSQAAVAAGPVGKWGDGKILDFMKKVLPIILELLPLFLAPAPAP